MADWSCPTCVRRNAEDALRCPCGEGRPGVELRTPSFHGKAADVFALHMLNLALTGLTLGAYYFEAKVQMRQYLYGMTRFDGDCLRFDGTPRELFIGWCKVAGLFAAVLGVKLALGYGPWFENGDMIGNRVSAVLALALLPLAIAGATRYRLARTSWRGIRFSFHGMPGQFWMVCLGGLVATVVSFGRRFPFVQNDVRRYLVTSTWLGDTVFGYDGRGEDLVDAFWEMVLWFLPTLGCSWFWYAAFRARYSWEHTHFQGSHFTCTVTGGQLCWLTLSNWLLIALTFGLAKPLADLRAWRFMVANLELVGPLDLSTVRQMAGAEGAVGEALTDFIGSGLALEL